MFGFTGTPIFAANAGSGGGTNLRTTEQAFGDKLHTYTIVDAITDKNVLPFKIDYINTVKSGLVEDKQISAIDTEKVLLSPERISQIVQYTLEHFDQKTKRETSYQHSVVVNVPESTRNRKQQEAISQKKRVYGFNAIFATASIHAAKKYYEEFARQQANRPDDKRLKIGMIYSYGVNDEVDGLLEDEAFDAEELTPDARVFLDNAIADYNAMFGTSYDTSADKFQNYYKDLSMRLKNRELDLVIVVNMFLTGFDATTLNTLFVDKNLRAHGLIQAFSRTNRILNSVKTCGNIVAFRNLEPETNSALELFGNKDARGIVLLKSFAEYYDQYSQKLAEFTERFPLGEQIIGEEAAREFINEFGAILRLNNILTVFDEFAEQNPLSERDFQDYRSIYLDIYAEMRPRIEKEIVNDDVVFEIELVKQVEVNVDYILLLVEKYRAKKGDGEDKEIRAEISRALASSPSLRNKRDLVEEFVDSISAKSDVDTEWAAFIATRKVAELEDIIERENLKSQQAREFMNSAFTYGELQTRGTEIMKILPPASRFGNTSGESASDKKRRVVSVLTDYFNRFFGLSES